MTAIRLPAAALVLLLFSAALMAGSSPAGAAPARAVPLAAAHPGKGVRRGHRSAGGGSLAARFRRLIGAAGAAVLRGSLSGPVLVPGDTGPDVLSVQQRLTDLGYWCGTPDGVFDDATEQAVFALQKAAGLEPDGTVGAQTRLALIEGTMPRPIPAEGYVIEVDLADDLVMFTNNGKVEYVLNTSTGGGYTYVERGVSSQAITPEGHFSIYDEVNGLVVDPLGQLWRPKYFDAGFALHGDSYVPPEPVSHGCVRVSDEAIDWIWADNLAPVGTAVWVY
ncbi:MAG TPA: L,D-transpeptidase family protein [Acidimicrobiales bacterium]|nr:L,D-transpeptidase family protein [Acidimicrobiales bacterium]